MSNQKPRVVVAHLGARKHYQEPLLFAQWGVLDRFYTDFYMGKYPLMKIIRKFGLAPYIPNKLKKVFERDGQLLPSDKVSHFPLLAYRYKRALSKVGHGPRAEIYLEINKEFCKQIIKQGLGDANILYAFNGAALELFQFAETQRIKCILDQTLVEMSFLHTLLLEEEQKWQNWSLSPFKVNESEVKLVQRQQQEQDLAAHIICGSQFVKDSLIARGVDKDKISVVPLGRLRDYDATNNYNDKSRAEDKSQNLKILFAGTVELRKGIPYLLEALNILAGEIPFTCKIAGSVNIKPGIVAKYQNVAEFLGRVPRSQMAELYRWADVFVLPSIAEGSAMVTYEALMYGLPVITTYNAGSIVRDGIDGFIVPIRDMEAIARSLIKIAATLKQNEHWSEDKNYLNQVNNQSIEILKQALENVLIS